MDLEFDGVRVERAGRQVLEIPSLRVGGGRTTAILGPNGSGKSTLLRLVAGLEHPSAGRILIERVPMRTPPQVAFVFQEQVFLKRSVRWNLELGLRLRRLDAAEMRVRVGNAAGLLGVAHLMDRRADQLSGGEGRRVSLARALCLRAPLALLDEPLEGLDERTYARLLDELPQLLAEFNATTLLVTHDRHEALRLADDLVILVDGRVHAAGAKRQVATNPRVIEVAEVLGYTVLRSEGRTIAVPPGALQPGPGPFAREMLVDGVLDLVDRRELLGRLGDIHVRIEWPAAADVPSRGARVLLHAARFYELEPGRPG